MAIGAGGRERIAARQRLAVNAHIESVGHIRVARAAGVRDGKLRDRRLRIVGGQNLVRAVAVGTDRGILRPVGHGAAVHARLIGDIRLRAFAVGLHQERLPVAAATGGWNVGVIHRRLGIAAAFDLVRVAVAILARGRRILSRLARLGVGRVRVGGCGIGVTLRAAHLFRRILVRQALYVLVAVHACEHAPVHRVLELVFIDGEAHRRAVRVRRGQCRVGVTSEAVRVLELLRQERARGRDEKGQNEDTSGKPTSNVHTLRRCRSKISRRDWSHKGSFQPSAISFQLSSRHYATLG